MNERLTFEERMTLLGALDTLSQSLTQHRHARTEGEREIYELALSVLGIMERD